MQGLNFNIYAVDFDGTLCNSKWPELGPPNEAVVQYVKHIKERGDKIILWTCRTGKMLEEAVCWCREQGLYFDAVNENLKEVQELYNGNCRKVSADYYIDDKSMTPYMVADIVNLINYLDETFKENKDGNM